MEGKPHTFAGLTSGRPRADTFWPQPGSEPVEWCVADRPVAYPDAVASMEDRVERIGAGTAAELIWLVEHPPLYTAGTSALDTELVDPRFPIHRAGRGGRYTYHGPGQRVIYVMLDLRRRRQDVRAFVAALEAWIIATLADLGIEAERRDSRVGVWVRRPDKSPGLDGTPAEDKIAAIGVRLRRWVSFHGVSLNIDPDLGHFSGIVPCGVSERQFGVTSLVDLGTPVSMPDVDALLRAQFERVFGPTQPGSEQSPIRLVPAHDGDE